MKKLLFIALFLVMPLIHNSAFAEKAISSEEGICGTRTAQKGAEIQCDPSQETCYISVKYTDGTTGTKDAIYVPGGTSFVDDGGSNTYTSPGDPAGSFWLHVLVTPNTQMLTFPSYSSFINYLLTY